MYILVADIIMGLHFFLIISLLVGIIISVKIKKARPIESIVLISAVVIWSLYGGCPLTYAENYFRIKGLQPIPILEQGFIAYYVTTWFGLYISGKTITTITYIASIMFFTLTIDWEWPYIKRRLRKRS